jgi:hypothetical protein
MLVVLPLLTLCTMNSGEAQADPPGRERSPSTSGYFREKTSKSAPARKQQPAKAAAERQVSYQDENEDLPPPPPASRSVESAPAAKRGYIESAPASKRDYMDAIGRNSYGFDGYEDGYDDNFHGDGDCCDTAEPCDCKQLSGGIAFTILRPYFSNNVALTTTEGNGSSFSNQTDTPFDFGMNLAPRIWLDCTRTSGLGGRITYWGFDQSSDAVTAQPAANGFGLISTPVFGIVDTSTNVPGESVSAQANLKMHTFDLEGTKGTSFGCWSLMAGAGLRYGSIEQSYQSSTRTAAGALQGNIAFSHDFEGAGPTVSFEARRTLNRCNLTLFSNARGSLLFGKSRSSLVAGEDLDLTTPFTTQRNTDQDDAMPIGEIQMGFDWRKNVCCRGDVFCRTALEGQIWQEAGNASSEAGNVGLFGFNVAIGFVR